jgi:hypothetical protein
VAARVPAQTARAHSFPWGRALGGALLVALGAGLAARKLRQRQTQTPEIVAPRVEKPALALRTEPVAPLPSPSAPRAEALQVALEPVRLSLTLLNAALAYRLEVTNASLAPLEALRIEADMISAHASLGREEQLGGPNGAATTHVVERLDPGESRTIEGEFRLPFAQIVPIRQGNAAMLLPLARIRAQAAGIGPVVRTFVVGQPGAGGLQPFRLDLGPRIYPDLAQRAFA